MRSREHGGTTPSLGRRVLVGALVTLAALMLAVPQEAAAQAASNMLQQPASSSLVGP